MSLTLEKFIALEDIQSDKEFIYNSYSINFLDSFQTTTKRIFDLFISIMFLFLVAWWLFLLISFFILIDSRGPIIFRQLRHGKNNRPFYCYKFRTMRYNPGDEFEQARRNDSRITRVGKFLRRTSMDELPQIINIFLGEMSVVGPRPHALPMNREYSNQISKFMYRHYVKPGVTGLAQCKGFRGEIKDERDIRFRLKYDLFYIKKWSVSFDIYIAFLTAKCIIFDNKNAY